MSIGQESGYSSFKILSTQWSIPKPDINQTKDAPLRSATPSASKPSGPFDHIASQVTSHPRRANATLVMLARNSDLNGVISSVEQMEAKFNRNFKYPWVFLNDEPFSVDFKRYTMSH
jgi:alpha 1,2-mannosyltransferase